MRSFQKFRLPFASAAAGGGVGPQQTQQPPVDDSASVADTGGDSGGCMPGGCLGCGCIGVVVLLVLTVAGAGIAAWKIPDMVGAQDWDEFVEVADGAFEAAEAADGSPGGIAGVSDPEDEEPGEFGGFFEGLEQTELSGGDIEQVGERLEDFEDSGDVEEFQELVEAIEEAESSDSALAQLGAIRNMLRLVFSFKRLGDAYYEQVAQPAGDGYQQLMAIVLVSDAGGSGDTDAWDQEVADALLEEHDEHREAFLETRQLLEEVAEQEIDSDELSDEERLELVEAQTGQFTMLPAAINRDSLEAWAALSDEERREVVEQIDSEHAWFGRIAAMQFHGLQEGDAYRPFFLFPGM